MEAMLRADPPSKETYKMLNGFISSEVFLNMKRP
jgi:hypothetical protein